MGEEVDDRLNKYSFSSSFPVDNSMFPVWYELLTVLSKSNETGAAIHLKNQMFQNTHQYIHVLESFGDWGGGGGGEGCNPQNFWWGAVVAQNL